MKKLNLFVLELATLTMYKTSICNHLNYGDVVYEQSKQPAIVYSKLTIETLEQGH